MREVLWRAALVALGIVLGALLIEAVLFLIDKPRFFTRHSNPPQFAFFQSGTGSIMYVNAPSQVIRFIYDGNPRGYFGKENEVDHKTNSWGFRGNEFSVDKPAGTFRLAFLGDSFTFGEGVNFADTYPEAVSRLLQEKYPSSSFRFESYNFGVGGYNTCQSLFIFRSVVQKTKPDAVVLGYTLNDPEPALFEINAKTGEVVRRSREVDIPEGLSDITPPKGFLYKLRIGRFLWQLVEDKKNTERSIIYYQRLFAEGNPGWQESKACLKALVQECREAKIPCYVIIFPILYQLNNHYPFGNIHAIISKEAEGTGAHVIDLLPFVRGKNAYKLWVHPTDQHPNELVHAIAAGVILKAIDGDVGLQRK